MSTYPEDLNNDDRDATIRFLGRSIDGMSYSAGHYVLAAECVRRMEKIEAEWKALRNELELIISHVPRGL